MTKFSKTFLCFRLLAVIFGSFFVNSAWAVYPDLTHPCKSPNDGEYCFIPLLGWDDFAREDDPFLFCTEGDPYSNIVVSITDMPPLPPATRAQPIAFYCPLLYPLECEGEKGLIPMIKGKTAVTSIEFSKRSDGRSEETVKVVTPPPFSTTTWYCPCYDTLKMALWWATCYDRPRGKWVNPIFDSNQLPFPH